MNSKLFLNLAILCTLPLLAADASDIKIRKYVEKHRNNPKALGDLLIAMGNWKEPDLPLAQELLTLGASSDARDPGSLFGGVLNHGNPGAAAITCAAGTAHVKFCELLLDNGADIETKCPWNGFTALMYAAMRCYNQKENESKESIETLKLLITRGANVNHRTKCMPTTALILAAEAGQVEKVKLLLESRADVFAKDEDGQTARENAKRQGERAKWLFESRQADAFAENPEIYEQIISLLEIAEQKQQA